MQPCVDTSGCVGGVGKVKSGKVMGGTPARIGAAMSDRAVARARRVIGLSIVN
jgi:hypothetical protein